MSSQWEFLERLNKAIKSDDAARSKKKIAYARKSMEDTANSHATRTKNTNFDYDLELAQALSVSIQKIISKPTQGEPIQPGFAAKRTTNNLNKPGENTQLEGDHLQQYFKQQTKIKQENFKNQIEELKNGTYQGKHLTFKGCDLTDAELIALGHVLANNNTIVSVDLSANRFTDNGINMFLALLSQNKTLLELNLQNICYSLDREIKTEGHNEIKDFETFFVRLANTAIVSLNIAYLKITNEGMQALSKMLMKKHDLKALNISGGCFNVDVLCKLLEKNHSLNTLILKHNAMDGEEIGRLTAALLKTNITTLDVSYNSLGTLGADFIRIFLMYKKKMLRLTLEYTSIEESTQTEIQKMVAQKINTEEAKFNFLMGMHNKIGKDSAICKTFAHNDLSDNRKDLTRLIFDFL